ncbi:MAG: hypothetical protein AAF587_25445 [Bacteroidota bacterium]
MKAIIAPIRVDALILPQTTVVKGAMADFTRLPYTDGGQDFNADSPYLGDSILSPPFEDKNLSLRAGVHVHWAMPKALSKTVGVKLLADWELDALADYFSESSVSWDTIRDNLKSSVLLATGWIEAAGENRSSILSFKAVDETSFNTQMNAFWTQYPLDEDMQISFLKDLTAILNKSLGSDYPCVPDLWLVRRLNSGTLEKSWVVESTYLSTESEAELMEEGVNDSIVNVPYHDDEHDNKSQPYRFLGRQSEITDSWSKDGDQYVQELTAVGYNPEEGSKGYAEPTFAAFYPNSMSVFGLYDEDMPDEPSDISYEVLGIYTDANNDYVNVFLKDYANRTPLEGISEDEWDAYFATVKESFSAEFQWTSATGFSGPSDLPGQSLLYGKVIPRVSGTPASNAIELAVGNTGTEALSAYVASKTETDGNKAQLEELLESIQLASQLHNRVLDTEYRFQEARHTKGFTANPGGYIWSIKLESKTAQTASDSNDNAQEITLSDELADLLNTTNTLQWTYDKEWREVPYLRRSLFSDWSKYMIGAYPPSDQLNSFFPPDEMMAYIQAVGIPELTDKLGALGTVSILNDEYGRFQQATYSGEESSTANQLSDSLNALETAIEAVNPSMVEEGADSSTAKILVLRQVPAPRYWRANDPVILFAESQSEGSSLSNDRYLQAGDTTETTCQLITSELYDGDAYAWTELTDLFDTVSALYATETEVGASESETVWNPFLLEWKIEYVSAFEASNHESDDLSYDTDFLTQHYDLPEVSPDVSLSASSDIRQTDIEETGAYTGYSLLTGTAGQSLGTVLDTFIANFGEQQSEEVLQNLNTAKDFVDSLDVLSQSLGGFHEAMLGQRQQRQLDIADPIGFPEYQSFAEEVSPLIESWNLTAPDPMSDFNPIRAGKMQVLGLRLVDTFGQTLEIDQASVYKPEPMSIEESEFIHLPARLSQPARLNFRFLSASSGEQEMNSHPASTPVCGWLLPNHLDRSLMFYDNEGNALGSLTMNASNPWMPAPTVSSIETYFSNSAFQNAYLQEVRDSILDLQRASIEANGSSDDSFLDHFLSALDKAQDNIEPENFAEHQDLAVLMGKPIAVVRAKLDLELEGPANTNQSWIKLTQELQGQGRSVDAFTAVKCPIRLGEYKQLNDGLFGYWVENSDGSLQDTFYSSEAESNVDHIQSYVSGGSPVNLSHAIDDDPVYVSMLVDPKGSIHATSGLLPSKSLYIPKDQYKDALKQIAVTFLTAPLLSPSDQVNLSLPKESGFSWSWMELNNIKEWQEIPQYIQISKSVFDTQFSDQPDLWANLISLGWIQENNGNSDKAYVTPAVQRAFPPTVDTPAFTQDVAQRLDQFFDAYGERIEAFDLHASLGNSQILREGWLKLSPNL